VSQHRPFPVLPYPVFPHASLLAVALLGAALAGCASISNSSNSVSESSGSVSSVSGSITDSSRSSGSSSSSLGSEESAALQRDVETAIALASESGGDADTVLRDVSALCERYALTDWETEPAVTSGIAQGLASAGVPEPEVARFARRAAGPDPALRDALRDALAARR